MITASRIVSIFGLGICVAGIIMDNALLMVGGAFVGLTALVNTFRR